MFGSCTRAANRAASAFAEDGRAHPNQGGTLFDGDLEIVAHAHRQLAEHLRRHAPRRQFVPDLPSRLNTAWRPQGPV